MHIKNPNELLCSPLRCSIFELKSSGSLKRKDRFLACFHPNKQTYCKVYLKLQTSRFAN